MRIQNNSCCPLMTNCKSETVQHFQQAAWKWGRLRTSAQSPALWHVGLCNKTSVCRLKTAFDASVTWYFASVCRYLGSGDDRGSERQQRSQEASTSGRDATNATSYAGGPSHQLHQVETLHAVALCMRGHPAQSVCQSTYYASLDYSLPANRLAKRCLDLLSHTGHPENMA